RSIYNEDGEFLNRCKTLRESLNSISKQIKAQSTIEGFHGTASTVVLLLLDPELHTRGSVFHAGDSRTYLYRANTLKQVTTDHSFLTAAGVKDAKKLPKRLRNMVTRVVGVQDEVPLEETAVQIKPGDIYLLCSDGLTNMVPDATIKKLFKKHENDDIASLAEALKENALDAGGDDNISVLLVKINESSAPPEELDDDVEDTVVIGKWRGEKGNASILSQSGPALLLLLVGGLALLFLFMKLLQQIFQ
ncbi:MAG: SpoIIE family protein phosphatase, partial [Verrucomicrobiota bacterium]